MDIDQPLVFRMSRVLPAIDDIQRRQPPWNTTCLTTREAFARLAAYELVTRPEVLDYNPVLATRDGRVYTLQTTPSTKAPPPMDMDSGKKGIPILRATPLQVMEAVLGNVDDHGNDNRRQDVRQVIQHLVTIAPQRVCCWYSLDLHKACAAPAATTGLATRPHSPYAYCFKHRVPALRGGGEHDDEDLDCPRNALTITPSSEQRLDEWLGSIV